MNSKKTLIRTNNFNNDFSRISKNELFRDINTSNVVQGQFIIEFGSKSFQVFKRRDNEFGIENSSKCDYTDLKGLHRFINKLKRNTIIEFEHF